MLDVSGTFSRVRVLGEASIDDAFKGIEAFDFVTIEELLEEMATE